MTDKRFYNGIELKKDLLWFKNIDHIPHITDIVFGYNTILEENEQLKKDVDYWKQVASKNSDEINVLECENCIHRKGIVCDLDGGHIDFTSWCDYFEYKGDDKND